VRKEKSKRGKKNELVKRRDTAQGKGGPAFVTAYSPSKEGDTQAGKKWQ